MMSWLKALLTPPTPMGPPRIFRSFKDDADPLCTRAEPVSTGEWRLADRPSGFAPLFQLENPGVNDCLITFRIEIGAESPVQGICIELLCRIPGHRRLVTRSQSLALRPEDGWHYFEITQHLERDQHPSLLRLGLSTETPGTIWIKNAKILATPVA